MNVNQTIYKSFKDEVIQSYINSFIGYGANYFIDNVETKLELLKIDDLTLPITINDEEYNSSYVCSPYNALIVYSKKELHKFNNKMLQKLLNLVICAFDGFLKFAKINKNIHVNNFLLSTNLYPNIIKNNIFRITNNIVTRFPEHTIIFRSLNNFTHEKILQYFTKLGYILIPSRQIYIFDCRKECFLKKRDTKQDYKLLTQSDYEIVRHDQIKEEDFARIVYLYNMLYLDKYSKHNPSYNIDFFKMCYESKFLNLIGLRNPEDQKLDAVLGYYEFSNVMTTPLFGYDTTKSKDIGLYRMITALLLQEAHKKKFILHSSSGAGRFKLTRGALPYIEYSALYYKHLPLRRKLPWKVIKTILEKVVVPLMQKYEL